MSVSKFFFTIAAVAAGILVLLWLISFISGTISNAARNSSQKQNQKKTTTKLDHLAAEQGLVFTDQLFYAPYGVSLSVDRKARKIVLSRNPYPDPVILDLDSIISCSVQNDLDAFFVLQDKVRDILKNKVLHQEAVLLSYKATVNKPIASITLQTHDREILLPFCVNEGHEIKKEILDESSRVLTQFADLLQDILK